LHPILAALIGIVVGLVTAVLVMMVISNFLPQLSQASSSFGLLGLGIGTLVGISAALFPMRRGNSRTVKTGGRELIDE
jgi:predicted lysophospholipase L1 biosynthesis ABC-type transport system permease subunit